MRAGRAAETGQALQTACMHVLDQDCPVKILVYPRVSSMWGLMSSMGVPSSISSLLTSILASLIPSTSTIDIPIGLGLIGEQRPNTPIPLPCSPDFCRRYRSENPGLLWKWKITTIRWPGSSPRSHSEYSSSMTSVPSTSETLQCRGRSWAPVRTKPMASSSMFILSLPAFAPTRAHCSPSYSMGQEPEDKTCGARALLTLRSLRAPSRTNNVRAHLGSDRGGRSASTHIAVWTAWSLLTDPGRELLTPLPPRPRSRGRTQGVGIGRYESLLVTD